MLTRFFFVQRRQRKKKREREEWREKERKEREDLKKRKREIKIGEEKSNSTSRRRSKTQDGGIQGQHIVFANAKAVALNTSAQYSMFDGQVTQHEMIVKVNIM